nr:hypothetical protein L203_05469 [Cryptococcus depauperatus CBS 7841]
MQQKSSHFVVPQPTTLPSYPPSSQAQQTHNISPPPSSQYCPLPSRETQQVRPPSQQAYSHNSSYGYGLASSTSQNFRVESNMPVSAQELFVQNRGKAITTASDKIMAAVKELGWQLSSLQGEVASLKNDNRQLRDQLHEIQQGQRALPTRDEVSEGVLNSVVPALQEKFHSHLNEVNGLVKPLSRNIVDIVLPQVKNLLAERDRAERTAREKDELNHQPLEGLLTHLVSKLGAVESIGNTLPAIRSISQAVGDIALCKDSLARLQLITEQSHMNNTSNESQKLREISYALQQSLQDLHLKVDKSSNASQLSSQLSDQLELSKFTSYTVTTNMNLGKVFDALKVLMANQNDLKLLVQGLSSDSYSFSDSQRSLHHIKTHVYSSQEGSQAYFATPLSKGMTLEKMAPPTPGFTSHIRAAHSSSIQVPSTQSSSTQSSFSGDRPLVGNSVTDIFGPKSYISGSGQTQVDSVIQEEDSQVGSDMPETKASEVKDNETTDLLNEPLAVSTAKSKKKARTQKKKIIPPTPCEVEHPLTQSISVEAQLHEETNNETTAVSEQTQVSCQGNIRRQTRNSPQNSSQAQSSDATSSLSKASKNTRRRARIPSHISDSQPTPEQVHLSHTLPVQSMQNHPSPSSPPMPISSSAIKSDKSVSSKGKKRIWDFSDDEDELKP